MGEFLKFPKVFYWGGAVSAEQTEGDGITNKAKTVFAKQFEMEPHAFYNGVGPHTVADVTRKYKEDFILLKDFNINSHRTSFSWARLFPEGDYSKPNQEAVRFYHDFIDEMIKNGIKPFITLYHFDMPMYAMDKGGWESREVWNEFLEYSKFVFNEYGSKVEYFTTMNEPLVPVQLSYLGNIQYPKLDSDQAGINAAYGVVMSHALVVNYFNDVIKKKYPNCKIGAIFDSSIVYPRNENDPEDVKAALYADLFQFTGLTDAMVKGHIRPELIEWVKDMDLFPTNHKQGDKDIISKVRVDLVGLNFYKPLRAKKPDVKTNRKIFNYFEFYNMPGRRENKFRGWEIFPEAIFDTFKIMKERYGTDVQYMLTEYGMGVEKEFRFRNNDGIIDDNYRVSFLKEHLEQLHRVITELGLNVIGAHAWATFDCWSWNNAYKNTYGLFEIDPVTLKRTPKSSAFFIKDVITNSGFENGYEKMEKYMDFEKVGYEKSVGAK